MQGFRAAALAVIACAGLVVAAQAPAAAASAVQHKATVSGPKVRVSPATGPPTSTVTVSGSGFGAFKAVDIYFDTTDKALAATSGAGSFSGITIGVPASARPGKHFVTAVQRRSGLSAQAPFLVNTNWPQFRYSVAHQGVNPFENVLSASSVAGIGRDWSFTTSSGPGSGVDSSPAVVNGVVYIGSGDGKVYAFGRVGAAVAPAHPSPDSLHPDYRLRLR